MQATAIKKPDNDEYQLVPYDLEQAVIEGLKSKYMDITIPEGDKDAYAMVMGGLRECRKIRLDADSWHKDKKAWINRAASHYDSERRRIHGLIEPIETHLKEVRKIEDDRIENERQEKIKQEELRVQVIKDKIELIRSTAVIPPTMGSDAIKEKLSTLNSFQVNEDIFMERLTEAQATLEESKRITQKALEDRIKWEEEQAKQKAEAERLEKIRKEQVEAQAKIDAENARIAEEQRKIQEEKDRIEAEKKAEQERKERAEREARIREEEKAKAEKEAKEKQEQEEKEKAEREEAERKEQARLKALKPDKEKLQTWGEELLAIPTPDLKSDAANGLMSDIWGKLEWVIEQLHEGMEVL